MTAVASMLLGSMGCIWVSRADRDLRWDVDQDGVERPEDCDDSDPAVSPDEPERCDDRDLDENCDGLVDDQDPSAVGLGTWCLDSDRDGKGAPGTEVTTCDPKPDQVADCTDCDDTDPYTTCEPTTTSECGPLPVAVLVTSEPVGEQGVTSFTTDASASTGEELQFGFDWGDGSPAEPFGPSPTGAHVYANSGWFALSVTVQDLCERTASAEVWVAVSPPGGLLRVSTGADENDPETAPPYLGTGLSLREALVLAATGGGVQVVAFEPGVVAVATGPSMPALTDDGGVLVGPGVVVDGSAGGTISVQGAGAIVAGIELVAFTDPLGAVHLVGNSTVAYGVTVRDSAVGLTVYGAGALVREVELYGSAGDQLVVAAPAVLQGLDVADGLGVGVRFLDVGVSSSLTLSRIRGNASSGVLLERGADDVSVLDSTIVGNGGDGVLAEATPPVDGLDLRNVIVAYNGLAGVSAKGQSFVSGAPGYNLWFANGLEDCSECGSLGDGALTVDPQFADPAGGDFTLLPASPVVDAGTPETGVDRNGPTTGSWFGAAPDIGAVEVR